MSCCCLYYSAFKTLPPPRLRVTEPVKPSGSFFRGGGGLLQVVYLLVGFYIFLGVLDRMKDSLTYWCNLGKK